MTGQTRMSFGIPDLLDGVEVTTLAVAMFAIGETLYIVAQGQTGDDKVEAVKGSVWMSAQDWARSWKAWLRGTLIGFP
ncbi:tripartite tricarboxylate transporter permease, partial [Xanthomonas translucens]